FVIADHFQRGEFGFIGKCGRIVSHSPVRSPIRTSSSDDAVECVLIADLSPLILPSGEEKCFVKIAPLLR
ncbi:MAG: hypothetical protein ACKVT0_21735, partial [Planctomycetaceae bacterium]